MGHPLKSVALVTVVRLVPHDDLLTICSCVKILICFPFPSCRAALSELLKGSEGTQQSAAQVSQAGCRGLHKVCKMQDKVLC